MIQKNVQIAFLVAVGSILFYVETLVPTPLPWMKLGLANLVSLLALRWWGMKEALVVVLMRVVLGSILTGKFLHPVFLLSVSGGVVATFVMDGAMTYGRHVFSLIGVSIVGALAKNATQLFMAYLLYIGQINVFWLLPFFLFSSLVTGLIVGLFAHFLVARVGWNVLPR